MLPFQEGAIDGATPARSRQGAATFWKRAVRVNRLYLRFARCLLSILLVAIVCALEPALGAKPKGGKKEKILTTTPSASAGQQSLANIPLPVGHEAKGLVLPDFDLEGHLRGRFEAVSAKRLDEYHIGFHALKITTYTENQPDLTIELSESVLNLNTRILSSNERSLIKRADFNIAGDSVEFDTSTRTGRLLGNVKMVITSQSQLLGNQNE